jgi:hypothetical protein
METKRKSDDWRELIENWEQSGVSQKEWCKRQQISFYTFRSWRSKLKSLDKSSDTESIKWIEVIGHKNASEGSHAVEIQYKDFKLNIHAPLADVLSALTKIL